MSIDMPRRKLKLPPIDLGEETAGQRLARLRKERGYSQVELAEKMGLIQSLVSDYERGKLRLNADMLARFALTLDVTTDEIIGLERKRPTAKAKSRRIQRRVEALERLPKRDQETVLRTIDAFLGRAS
jgi:transcriptional regulator with XRE-family HTH domain